MAQFAATLDVPLGWERFSWEGTLGGVRHLAESAGFHPNVLVLADEWPAGVGVAQLSEFVQKNFDAAGIEVLSLQEIPDEPGVIVADTRQLDADSGAAMWVRYRFQLRPERERVVVVTSVATCTAEQFAAVEADFAEILRSVKVEAVSTRDA